MLGEVHQSSEMGTSYGQGHSPRGLTGGHDAIGDYVEGHSPSIGEEITMEQQLADAIVTSNDAIDMDAINNNVEKAHETETILDTFQVIFRKAGKVETK